MLKRYEVLLEESLNIDKNKYKLEPKLCYNNVFNFYLEEVEKFKKKDYIVCYGFVITKLTNDSMAIRHAFILDSKQDKILDPTLQFFSNNQNSEYLIFKKLKPNEYLNLLGIDGYPSLEKVLSKEQLEFQKLLLGDKNKSFTQFPMDILPID